MPSKYISNFGKWSYHYKELKEALSSLKTILTLELDPNTIVLHDTKCL